MRSASGVAPWSASSSMRDVTALGNGSVNAAAMASLAPLSTVRPSTVRTPLVRVSARNGMSSATVAASVGEARVIARPGRGADGCQPGPGQLHDGAAFRRLVVDARQQRSCKHLRVGHPGARA